RMTIVQVTAPPILHTDREFERDQYGRPRVYLPNDHDANRGRFGSNHGYYTRPTTLAGTLADRFGIERWRCAQVAVGIGLRPDLAVAATVYRNDNSRLYELVEQAEEAAAVAASATMGEAKHKVTADILLGHYGLEDVTPLLADEITAILDVELNAFSGIEGVEFAIVN